MVKCTPRVAYFFDFFDPVISRAPLQKKNNQQFQALNSLKYSTVGNLDS